MKGGVSNPSGAQLSASVRLKAQRERILEFWLERVRQALPAAKAQHEPQLRDSLPEFLDLLALALSPEGLPPRSSDDLNDVSQDHGKQRSRFEGYSLQQLLREYQLLREVLFGVLEREAPLTPTERDILLSAIEQAMAEAGERFMQDVQSRERAAEERYRLIIESAKDHAIIRTSPDGKLVDWNAGAENIFQYRKDEVLGRDSRLLFTPEDRAQGAAEREMETAIATGRAEDTRWHPKKDGSRFFATGVMNPLRDAEGRLLGFVKLLRDDTARKEAERVRDSSEARLRIAQEQLQLALRSAQMGTWHIDLATNRATISPELAALLGVAEHSDNIFELIATLMHPEDRDEVNRVWQEAVAAGTPYQHEYRIIRPDGSIRWILARGTVTPGPDGRPAYFSGVSEDVTDRKLAEQRGEAAKKELEEIFLQAPAPFVVMSGPEHRFILANPPYERLVNRKVLGKTLQEAFTEEGALQTLSVIDKVYRTGEPHVWKELPIALPDEHGNVREHYLNVSYTALRDSQGRISAVTGLVLDVTEQVRARQEVTRVLDAVPQIIWIADAQGEIQFVSRQWHEFTGLDPGNGNLGRQFELVMHPDDVAVNVRAVQEAQRRRGPISLVHRLRAPDGEYRWVLARGNPTFSDSGELTGWIGVTIDVHEQRLVQEELARAVEHLQEERELRERFVATLSHDLRTPLTAAKMGTHLLLRRGGDPVALTKTAGRIADNIDRADRMIRDLLDANRLTAGETLPAEFTPCDLTAIARETLEELAQVHGDRFVLSAPDSTEGHWSGSALRRILENLCHNAIKYGARDRAVTVALTRSRPEEVLLSVHNWGPPIPLEDQKSLFEPYRRMKSAQAGKEKGWGLGLTLVRGLAEAHHGTVQVESTEASGTTFTVILPSDSRP